MMQLGLLSCILLGFLMTVAKVLLFSCISKLRLAELCEMALTFIAVFVKKYNS